ncbi:polysaccharide deacetylase family protein [Azorhizobium doebereinerae]|uniref:polysaccharide deacetylase family protein n=1 Tax=Azorhizobium doebereinerae TaxID=281091 RepID=UPI000687F1E0
MSEDIARDPINCLPVEIGGKPIYLTFDDGPHPTYTPLILDILTQYSALASFFVIGNRVEACPGIVRRASFDGHCIGNHTLTHRSLDICADEVVMEEVCGGTDAIKKLKSMNPVRHFRAPFGVWTENALNYARACGQIPIHWSIDTMDWSGRDAQMIVDTVANNAVPGSIILMHDSAPPAEERTSPELCNRRNTVEAVSIIIPMLQARGFSLLNLP